MAEISYLETIRKKFGWEDFPFSLDIIPEIFAGKEKILDPIMGQIAIGTVVFIEGNYGSGKSQVLRHIQFKLKNDPQYARYIPILIQEPLTTGVLVHSFKRKFSIDAKIELVSDLVDELDALLDRKKTIILLVDEAQEIVVKDGDPQDVIDEKKKTVQWIRVLSDYSRCRIFMAGLVNFGRKLSEMFRPLEDRVSATFLLEPFDLETSIALIKERAAYFTENNGPSLTPFTSDALTMIFNISGGYPRAILRLCQDAVIQMLSQPRKKNAYAIDAEDIKNLPEAKEVLKISPSLAAIQKKESEDLEHEMKTFREKITYDAEGFSPTTLDVLRFMATRDEVTPQDVAEACGITSGTAGNVLKNLYDIKYVFRKPKGRTYSYTLFSAYRREFMQA